MHLSQVAEPTYTNLTICCFPTFINVFFKIPIYLSIIYSEIYIIAKILKDQSNKKPKSACQMIQLGSYVGPDMFCV